MSLRFQPGERWPRLDRFLQERFPQHSRSRLQSWIKAGRVRVNGEPAKAAMPLQGGEMIEVEPAGLPPLRAFAEELPLEILYEDEGPVPARW